MAMNALRFLVDQHREIEKWFDQLEQACEASAHEVERPAGPGNWHLRETDSGETLQESAEHGAVGWAAGQPHQLTRGAQTASPLGIPTESELERTASPPPSEADGRSEDAFPGEEFRDRAGHHADGKTHVGMDEDRLQAQMFDPATGRPRADSAVGQQRENLAGAKNQLDNPKMAWATGGRVGVARAAVSPEDRALAPKESTQPGSEGKDRTPDSWATPQGQPGAAPARDLPLPEPVKGGAAVSPGQQGRPQGLDAPAARAVPQEQGGLRTAGGGAQFAGGSRAENIGAAGTAAGQPLPGQVQPVTTAPEAGPAHLPPPLSDVPAHTPDEVLGSHNHRQALLNRLCDHLLAHSAVEEQLLYPLLRETLGDDITDDSLQEHQELRLLIEELRSSGVDASDFEERLLDLREMVEHHVGVEEADVLPRLAEKLGNPRMEELGAQLQEKHRSLVGIERRFAISGAEGLLPTEPPTPPAPKPHLHPRGH